jgi:N-acetylmuramoyl-L-alanine amidase
MAKLRERDRTVRNRGVRQAPFYVLIGAEMPAILVEVGYITNPAENRKLCNRNHLERIASGIVNGIDLYVKDMEVSFKGG